MGDSPAVILYDANGNEIETSTSAPAGTERGIITRNIPSGTQAISHANLDVALSTRASEATLASADGRLTTIDAVLDSIKDTDGIKKITDQLPAGSNEIGAVAQGTKAAAADAWPTVLYDDSGNKVGVVLDGAIYRLQTETKLATGHGLATESTLALVKAKTDNLDVLLSTRATESTLSAADTKLGNIEADVDSIRATDGIKKITDPLPSGTNEIGKAAQGTKGSGANAWPQVLYDASGNAVGVVLDNSIYRLETRSSLVGQVGGSGAETKVTVIADTDDANQKRLQTEARLAPGSTVNIGTGIPANPADLVLDTLKNGGSSSMRVAGTLGTPIDFTLNADPTDDISVEQLRIVFSADDISFDGASFGPLSGLTNGLLVQTFINSVTTDLYTIKVNEDFVRIPGPTPLVNNTGPKDFLVSAFGFGGLLKLAGGSSDYIRIRVRDTLTSVQLKYLQATVYGAKG